MKKVLFLLVMAALTLTACQKKAEQVQKVYTIDEMLLAADSLAGDTIVFEGVCAHICKHGGAKAFLLGSSEEQMICVQAAEAGNFTPECVNAIVRINGVLQVFEYMPEVCEGEENLQHGEGEGGCETEKKAVRGYYVDALSYEIVPAE